MKKPSKVCLKAVKELTKHHADDCATYYSLDGSSAVLVINDPEIAHKMVFIMGMVIEHLDDENFLEVDGVPVFLPPEPIEA